MSHKVMVKALNVIKDSVINTEFPLTNKLADAIYAIEAELAKPEQDKPLRLSPMYEYGHIHDAAQPEPQVCCGDYEKCWKACTPRGRWLAKKESRKEWVGLTSIEVRRLKDIHIPMYSIPILDDYLNFYRAIENELKDKNTT